MVALMAAWHPGEEWKPGQKDRPYPWPSPFNGAPSKCELRALGRQLREARLHLASLVHRRVVEDGDE